MGRGDARKRLRLPLILGLLLPGAWLPACTRVALAPGEHVITLEVQGREGGRGACGGPTP